MARSNVPCMINARGKSLALIKSNAYFLERNVYAIFLFIVKNYKDFCAIFRPESNKERNNKVNKCQGIHK